MGQGEKSGFYFNTLFTLQNYVDLAYINCYTRYKHNLYDRALRWDNQKQLLIL
jgi:hypothetical protein